MGEGADSYGSYQVPIIFKYNVNVYHREESSNHLIKTGLRSSQLRTFPLKSPINSYSGVIPLNCDRFWVYRIDTVASMVTNRTGSLRIMQAA